MPIIKGALFAFGAFLALVVAFVVIFMARGGGIIALFVVTRLGLFLVGFGLGTTTIGGVMLLLGRLAGAHIRRVMG
jgi:hypothetical protein